MDFILFLKLPLNALQRFIFLFQEVVELEESWYLLNAKIREGRAALQVKQRQFDGAKFKGRTAAVIKSGRFYKSDSKSI